MILYRGHQHEAKPSISLQYVLSPCPGIFLNDKYLLNSIPNGISFTEYDDGLTLALPKSPNGCMVVQSLLEGAQQYNVIMIEGSRTEEVFQIDILRVSIDKL